jgi:hypothetical protein
LMYMEDAERVISSVNGRRTDNTMAKREKWQNDKVLQVTTHNVKDWLTRNLLKTWGCNNDKLTTHGHGIKRLYL